MTGTSCGAPQDGDLVLCQHSLMEACSLTPSAHTHMCTRMHTHTLKVCLYLPPFKSECWIHIPEKLYKQNIGEVQYMLVFCSTQRGIVQSLLFAKNTLK